MNSKRVLSGLDIHAFKAFELKTLVVESLLLRGNPQGDRSERRCPVLIPFASAPTNGWPIVFVLSGFTGNGPKAFNVKFGEEAWPVTLDKLVDSGEAPKAIYVFVDAITFWGGSQFIDSAGLGRYESFITEELLPAVRSSFSAREGAAHCAVMGGSSGGYGALHLSSKRPDLFGWCLSIAPDSFFEASLLNEFRTALPVIAKMGGVSAVRRELNDGKLLRRKDWHTIVNVVAMGLAYASSEDGSIRWPIDETTGTVKDEVWSEWLKWDPVHFIRDRAANVKKLSGIYLDVGTRDQFQLQYGTRLIANVLKEIGAAADCMEFDGTHFDIGERRADSLAWLATHWRV
jgi:S-formylglutathione hydrolase FrmB